MAGFTIGTT